MADFKEPIRIISRRPVSSQPRHQSQRVQERDGGIHGDDPRVQQVRQAIAAVASRNTELLRDLSATADAPGLFAHNENKALHTSQRLKEQQTQVEFATVGARLQHDKHKKFHNSLGRRLVYTLSNRKTLFDVKASLEEKHYHEALEKRSKAERALSDLKADQRALEAEGRVLKARLEKHSAAHKAIDVLYASLFDGPTPGFPDEDAQEYRHKSAKSEHEDMMETTKAAAQGVKAVSAIHIALDRAKFEATVADGEANTRLGSTSIVEARLERSLRYVDRAIELSNEAIAGLPPPLSPGLAGAKQALDRILQTIKHTPTERSHFRSNPAVVTSKLRHDVVGPARAAQQRYEEEMVSFMRACRERIRDTARALEDERQSLQQIRQGAFERTVGFGEAAPPYNECCDRAGWFEDEADARCRTVTQPVVEEFGDLPPPPEYEEALGPGTDVHAGEAASLNPAPKHGELTRPRQAGVDPGPGSVVA